MTAERMAEVVGGDVSVPVVSGELVPYVNLDFAASAPALVQVAEEVDAFLPWYSSVHRGTGYKSRVATKLYEQAREDVARFLGARPDDVVVFTRNTTDSLNLLASALPPETRVLTFEAEHHANLLPWRRGCVRHLPLPAGPSEAIDAIEQALHEERRSNVLVSVTGASNVTGELWPIADIARAAHRAGARICVDAAQLAPHAPVDMEKWGIDYAVISGHKLYAPYGAGALVGRPDWLHVADPWLAGGGAVTFVTTDEVVWREAPERHEAGSPNVIGAFALAAACRALAAIGMDKVALHEAALAAYANKRLGEVPGLERYAMWSEPGDRIGIVTCNLRGYDHDLLATILSAEHGIGVRAGCFCAHPLMLRLLSVGDEHAESLREALLRGENVGLPGAVRISTGVSTTEADIDVVCDAIATVATTGPRWRYRRDEGGWRPDPETRQHPPSVSVLRGTGM